MPEPKSTNIDYDGLGKRLESIAPRPKTATRAPSVEDIRAALTTHAQVQEDPGEQLDSQDVPVSPRDQGDRGPVPNPEFLDFADAWLEQNPDASPDDLVPMEADRVIGDQLEGGLDLGEYAREKLSQLPPEIQQIIDRATHGEPMQNQDDGVYPLESLAKHEVASELLRNASGELFLKVDDRHAPMPIPRDAAIRRFGPVFAQVAEDVEAFDDGDVWGDIIRRVQDSGQDTRCPQCPGDQPMVLGPLGDLLHVRCQHCGWDYALKIPPKEPLPEPEKPGLPTDLAKDNSNRFIHVAQLRNHMLPGNWREQVNRPPIDWRKLNLGKERGYCPECTDLIGSTMERVRSGDAPEGVPDDFDSIVRILSRAEALCGGRDCSPRRNLQDEGNTMSDEIAEELGGDRMASSRSASCECDGDWTKDGKPCPACSCGAETCPCNCHDDCECPHCKGSRKDAKVHDDLSTRLASSGFLGSPNPELVATLSAALGSGQLARPGLVRRAQLDDPFGDDPPEPTPEEVEALRLESERKHQEWIESMSPEERRFYEETGMTFEEADRQQAAEIEGERRNEQALFGPWDLGEDEDDRRYHLASNRFARFYTSQDMKDEADRCPKCGGSGDYVGGRFTKENPGMCFECGGTGKKKADKEASASNRFTRIAQSGGSRVIYQGPEGLVLQSPQGALEVFAPTDVQAPGTISIGGQAYAPVRTIDPRDAEELMADVDVQDMADRYDPSGMGGVGPGPSVAPAEMPGFDMMASSGSRFVRLAGIGGILESLRGLVDPRRARIRARLRGIGGKPNMDPTPDRSVIDILNEQLETPTRLDPASKMRLPVQVRDQHSV